MKKNAVRTYISFGIIWSPFIVKCIIGIDSFQVEYFLTITMCMSGLFYLINIFIRSLGELIDDWSKGSRTKQRNDKIAERNAMEAEKLNRLICGCKSVSMALQDSEGATNKGINELESIILLPTDKKRTRAESFT